jgi:Response regulator receiver domain
MICGTKLALIRSSLPNNTPSRVLVVDDNADIARVTSLLLQHFGFDVQTLFDGRLVQATARSFRPHFVLLDIGLPWMDDYRAAEQLRGDMDLKDIAFGGRQSAVDEPFLFPHLVSPRAPYSIPLMGQLTPPRRKTAI